MKKKVLSILLIGVLIVCLTGCGSDSKELNNNTQNQKNDEKIDEKNESKEDTITCRLLGDSNSYDKKEEVYIYKNGKLYQWILQKITKNGATKSELEKLCGKANENNHGRINIVEENSCYYLFDFEKMTEEELSYFSNIKKIMTRSIEENYDYLTNGINMACVYGKEEVKIIYPKSINGKYKGINTDKDESGNRINEELTVEFNDGKYSYNLNNQTYTGTYTYNGKKLILNSENSEAITFGVRWWTKGEFIVYENINGYDLFITDNIGATILKLNKN